jgi:putative ABC transport system permease protein
MNQTLLVAKNLGRRKLRAFLMLIAICIAFFLYGFLECFNSAFHSGENSAAADRLVTVNRINFTMPVPVNYAGRISTVPGVSAVTYQSWFGGYFQDQRQPMFMFAVDPESYLAVYPSVRMSAEQRRAWISNRTAIAVGKTTAAKYRWKVGDRVPIASNIYSRKEGVRRRCCVLRSRRHGTRGTGADAPRLLRRKRDLRARSGQHDHLLYDLRAA